MNKKMIVILIILLLLSALFSGCTEESKPTEENSNSPDNYSPTGLISAPDSAFFGDKIEFDASRSYDSDGEIVSYDWDFGDETTAEGAIVEHIYKFGNDFTIDYPLIYPVYLFVKDDKGSITAISHQIKVYPGQYVFYFNSEKLTIEKPSSSADKMRGSGLFKLFSPQILTYDLDSSIIISKCDWNATIYLNKPLFSIMSKISIILYDNEGNEIITKDEKLGHSLWFEKTVKIKGSFDEEYDFKTVKITIYGLSLRKEISILYGGEKASQICFDFTT